MKENSEISNANSKSIKKIITLGNLEKVVGFGLAISGIWLYFSSENPFDKNSPKIIPMMGGVAYIGWYASKNFENIQKGYSNLRKKYFSKKYFDLK